MNPKAIPIIPIPKIAKTHENSLPLVLVGFMSPYPSVEYHTRKKSA